MLKNYLSDIAVALLMLGLGVGAGYWYGNITGIQAGIDQEKAFAAARQAEEDRKLSNAANPFNETSTNPFADSSANPYKDVKTNPFE